MPLLPVTLTGEHAQLVPLEHAHAEALFRVSRDPRIWQYMPVNVESMEDMRDWVAGSLNDRQRGVSMPFVIVDRRSEQVVGSTRYLDYDERNRAVEIGFTWLNPDSWRTPINTECKYLLLTHCFESLGLIRVQLKTDSRNLRSQAAIERIGGVREGVLRSHRIMPDGYLRDSVYFSIIGSEWPAVKARLEDLMKRHV
jgi:RimJ/RimL family protein N-acetyltransferase